MFKVDFKDTIESKYTYIGCFIEGLAAVQNQSGFWGYIDKEGKEVIPCKYISAFNFSEDLALVSAAVYDGRSNCKCGFIDKNGKIKIPLKYDGAAIFSEGLAAVQNQNGFWGYIDRTGKEVIPCQFLYALGFKDGYAVVKLTNGKYAHIDKTGKLYDSHDRVSNFNNGYATVFDSSDIYNIDTNQEIHSTMHTDALDVFEEHCGLQRFETKDHLYGYVDRDFNVVWPSLFTKAHDFKDDAAIVEPDDNTIGFITKDRRVILFFKNKYSEINDFSEGLAAVRDQNGLWGYIDKNGKEVIPCQFEEAYIFSEGLACVLDSNGLYCIDKKGNKKLGFKYTYKSTLDTGYEKVEIEADSKEEFYKKKIDTLNNLKNKYVQQVNDTFDTSIDDVSNKLNKSKKGN